MRKDAQADAGPGEEAEEEAAERPPELPLVIVENVKSAMRIQAVSPLARKAGLSVGMTLADARSRIPNLRVEEMDARADASLLDLIAEDCDRFSPVVVVDAPDGLLLDITGCTHLFGGEAELRKAFSLRLQRAGFHVRTVIADAPDSARAIARYGRVAIVAPGEDAATVRRLPIAALGLDSDDLRTILRAGLKTVGAVADRPSAAFAARFSEEMTRRLRRILGKEAPPLEPRRAVPMLWAERRFPEPIGRAEDVEATLAELGQEAGERLAERREGGRLFEASFFRADGAVRRIAIETGRPMRNTKVLLRLFRERIDALADPIDPGFGFDLIRLCVPVTEKLETIQTGLDGHAIDADEIADLADRLSTRFGSGRVVRFMPNDTHDPERAADAAPAAFNPLTSLVWPEPEKEEPPLRPVQMFDPPQPVTVTMAEIPDGPPQGFEWRRREYRVIRAEGPERISPEWWRSEVKADRDYYRIEDADGRRFWLFRSGEYGKAAPPGWYVHGVFA